jgi:hypothetical protein
MKLERDRQIDSAWRRGQRDEPLGRAMTDADLERVAGGAGGTIKIVVPSLTDDELTGVVGGRVIIPPPIFPDAE